MYAALVRIKLEQQKKQLEYDSLEKRVKDLEDRNEGMRQRAVEFHAQILAEQQKRALDAEHDAKVPFVKRVAK